MSVALLPLLVRIAASVEPKQVLWDALGWPAPRGDASNSGASAGLGPSRLNGAVRTLSVAGSGPNPPPTDVGRPPLFDNFGSVFAFDYTGECTVVRARASDGALLWRVGLNVDPGNASTDGGIVLSSDGLLVVVVSSDGVVRTLRTADGSDVWVADTGSAAAINSPAVSNGRVVCVFSDGTVRALAVATGAELWRASFGFNVDPLPLAQVPVAFHDLSGTSEAVLLATLGNSTFTDSPSVWSFDAATGSRRWVSGLPQVYSPTTELVVSSSRIFFGCGDGVIALNASDGAVVWHRTPSGHPSVGVVSGAPVIAEALGYVLVNELYSGLFALHMDTGENAWYSADQFAYTAGALDAGGIYYLINIDGGLGSFAAANGTLFTLVAVPNALGSSSPALDGNGRLALFASGTSSLILIGGSGGGLPASQVSPAGIAIASAAATSLAAIALYASWRYWLARKARAIVPRSHVSVATSIGDDLDDSTTGSGAGTFLSAPLLRAHDGDAGAGGWSGSTAHAAGGGVRDGKAGAAVDESRVADEPQHGDSAGFNAVAVASSPAALPRAASLAPSQRGAPAFYAQALIPMDTAGRSPPGKNLLRSVRLSFPDSEALNTEASFEFDTIVDKLDGDSFVLGTAGSREQKESAL